jgi:hypothetical protein
MAAKPTTNNVTKQITTFFQTTSGQTLASKVFVDPFAKRGRGNEAAATVIGPDHVAAKKQKPGTSEEYRV